jgi:hypothetical protein
MGFAFAQEFLVLEKMGTKKRVEYHIDDQIVFRIRGEENFRRDIIITIFDSTIVFNSGPIKLFDIEQIKPPAKAWMVATGGTFVVAGVGYFVIDQFNKLYVGNGLYYDPKVMRTSIILSGIGASLILLSKRKVKVKKNWRLRYVSIY